MTNNSVLEVTITSYWFGILTQLNQFLNTAITLQLLKPWLGHLINMVSWHLVEEQLTELSDSETLSMEQQ